MPGGTSLSTLVMAILAFLSFSFSAFSLSLLNLMLPEQSSTMAIEPVPCPNFLMMSALALTATPASGGSAGAGPIATKASNRMKLDRGLDREDLTPKESRDGQLAHA